MGLKPPGWHSLFEGVVHIDTTAARQNLSNNVRLVEQNNSRVVLTTYSSPRVALIPLRDLALLQALDLYPELRAKIEKLLPE